MKKLKELLKTFFSGVFVVMLSAYSVVCMGFFTYGMYKIMDMSGWVAIIQFITGIVCFLCGVLGFLAVGKIYNGYRTVNKSSESVEADMCDEEDNFQVTYLYKVIGDNNEAFVTINIEDGGYKSLEDVEKDTKRIFRHVSDERCFDGVRLLIYQMVRSDKGFNGYKKYYVICSVDSISIVLREGDK